MIHKSTRADKQFNVLFLTQYACFHLFESLSVGNARAVARPYVTISCARKTDWKIERIDFLQRVSFQGKFIHGENIIKIIIKIANNT